MNIVTDIKTKNFIHELTGIAQLRKYLDEGKIPSGYDELLKTKEPKLKKIINFLRANPEPAEILFMYIEHLENEAEKSIKNRDMTIQMMSKNLSELETKYQKNEYFFNFVRNNRDKSFTSNYKFRNGELIPAGTMLRVNEVVKIFYDNYKNSSYIIDVKKRLNIYDELTDEKEKQKNYNLILNYLQNTFYDIQKRKAKTKKAKSKKNYVAT